ncbi:Stk1 family PASTA domain-containing Ser/Thr kinase [Bacillus chungangensis]|uniref:Stk1 family PASTA domain-containing Ser/Thr kinase n=1 Tax=Bacillus chungangensis TaxID=587633 RepID=UPI0027D86EDA|nr:Stk1 family PASTA domain-containing Ser/Thr kinase [Bacillus chungangensis]
MLIGKRISGGRYKILEMIGGGGMANVYLARDCILDRDVAIKILRLDFANEDELIRRFQREAQSATSLTHPNIVSIYDVGEEKDIYYIVMEYVDGMTLKQYIQQFHPIPVEKVRDIMKQLTSAISHAHQNHIIHRDIKPQNILIDHDGNVKITDFGIAMALSATSITQTNSVLGSVHYLSPEQARGGMATEKSDIYSLGIVLFELLTGRLPFSGESAVSIALKHLQAETPALRRWNPNIPQSMENIVFKATAKDLFQRYHSVDEMHEDIDTALDEARRNEPKFHVPEDHDATKAIPILTNQEEDHDQNLDETKIRRDKVEKRDTIHQGSQKKNGKQQKKKPKKKKWPFIVAISFIFLFVLSIFALTFFPGLVGPKEIKVPDVSGEELEDAIASLLSAGFVIGDTIDMNSDEIEAGEVVKTKPKGGKKAKKGSSVDVYLSIGREKSVVDDYIGRDIDDVMKLLEKNGFKGDIVREEVHDDNPPGTIIDQNPLPRTEVFPDETVFTFTVSKGLEQISLKDLREYNVKGLNDYADSTGLVIDMSSEEYSDTVREGLVISQSHKPGTLLNKGDKIKVVLSKGQKEIPPKTIFKEIVIPYDPGEETDDDAIGGEKKPQEIQIYIEDMNNSMTEANETFLITETTKKRLEFNIEHGKKAGYKVIRDQSVLMEEVIPYPED